ncbi:hypothetical protein KUCAC02_009359 [Chaenocephalus aceratus]|uniref:Uncharacterized protein n=1 Tax=Chaenocephalus aceratus TaxID=36190 RepID=A0ACB9WU01_CHAAC|nr:hypothetical protein KUCAC02_009359 [Chaenocephalus aceratus]
MSKTKNKSENKTEKALAAEKEQFAKQQLHSISKTLVSVETPLKEKYVRNIIMGTYKESGAATFWSYTLNLPLSSNSMICWKFCYLLHKVLRGGQRNVVRDSHRYCRNVKDMGVLWGSLHDRYGQIVALSAKFLCLKMEFHAKHKLIPGNLEASDETLDKETGNDKNKVLDMTQELMDYLDAGLKMEETVLRQLDANGAKSDTPAGQCRLTPLIPDTGLQLPLPLQCPADVQTAQLHGSRYSSGTPRAVPRSFLTASNNSLTETEKLSFLKLSSRSQISLMLHQTSSRAVVGDTYEDRTDREEAEQQPETRDAPQMPQYYCQTKWEHRIFQWTKGKPKNEGLKRELQALRPELQLIKSEARRCLTELKSQVNRLEAEVEEERNYKQMAMVEKEHLRMEVEGLRCANVANVGAQIGYKEADHRAQSAELRFTQLKERHAELITSHADLMKKNAETVKLFSGTKHGHDDLLRSKQQLEIELENLRRENSNMMNQQQQEFQRLNQELLEQRAQLALLRSTLDNKDMEGSQVSSSLAALHAEREVLLRSAREKDAELSSLRQQAQQQQGSQDLERDRLLRELEALRAQLQQQLTINAEQKLEIDHLRRELDLTRSELNRANGALQSREMSGTQLSSSLAGLQAEREVLLRSMRDQEAELNSLRQQAQLHHSSLEQERQRSSMEVGSLHAQIQQQACREGELTQKLQDEQFCLLQCAVVEAEGIILDAVAKLDDPIHLSCISSPDYLINRAEITLGSIDKMQQSHVVYLGNRNDASGLLRAVTQFSHLTADTIVNGAAASHSAPTDQADCLTDSCRDCANHCLQFLKDLKIQASLQRADPSAVRFTVQRLLGLAQGLRPTGQDLQKGELEYLVDKEMIATSTAIEEAVLRMGEIMNQAKKDTSGIKLEVNQSILGSCSDLMKAVHMLVTASADLQKDIVEGGRGAASVTEFYGKNSRWTEGLISASKAVGWGATQLLDSADRVVAEKGAYEELIACSHEIAASTAQLLAASKVKADRNNKKLQTLKQASRHVNDMAAVVVTSTKHGQEKISDPVLMDFSGRSLIKLKTEEMETQVRVLQLESQLEQERVRLGELRKRHYELHSSVDEADEDPDSFPPPPPPTLLDSPTANQSIPQTQPYITTHTNPFAPSQTQPQSYTPTLPQAQTYTPSTASQIYTPSLTTTSSQIYTPSLTTTSSQIYTPSLTTTSSQIYTPSLTTTSSQIYTPSLTTTSSQIYTPSLTSTSSQLYTPSQTSISSQIHTPSQTYTPPQTYTPSQPFIPSQAYTPQPYITQPYTTYLNPQSYSLSTPSTQTSPSLSRPQSPSLARADPQNAETVKPASRKPNIFTKSGNLLKNAFKRGETGTGES